MSEDVSLQLAGIVILGILVQWIAWRVRCPSILLLLAVGALAGPVSGWLHPDQVYGQLLLPLVSLSVGVILYGGGLSLKFRELRHVGSVFVRLATVGVAVSWLTGAVAAHFLLGLPWPVATLLGAIMVVTGPTVIGPILRHLRLRGRIGVLLKWEGIVIDPLGATLSLLAFTMVEAEALRDGIMAAAVHLGVSLVVGVLAGYLAAGVLVVAFSRFWVPDFLHNPVSLMFMFGTHTAANLVQDESGLLAVTVMGIALANQKSVSIRHVIEFKDNLTILLVSMLFIILSARMSPDDLRGLGWESLVFVAVMVLVARPASVLSATWGSSLTWQERIFLCCMAPRGIVAASVTSVFALNLVTLGYPHAVQMIPLTFLLVFVTVLLYGTIAMPLARWLGLIQTNPQGILFIGADLWVRALARALHEEGCPVVLIDTDWEKVSHARLAGLPCLHGSALAEETREDIDYTGLGRMLAVTSNNEVNSLACLRYTEDFGRQEVYQLTLATAREGRHEPVSQEHRGRLLFGPDRTYSALLEWTGRQPSVRKTRLTTASDFKYFHAERENRLAPLCVLKPNGTIQIVTVNEPADARAGDLVFSLVGSTSEERPIPPPHISRSSPETSRGQRPSSRTTRPD